MLAQLPSYGIPSYASPRPYQTPGADSHKPTPNPGFGDTSRSPWHYKAPADYSTPVNYHTPKAYGAPKAYSAEGGAELGTPGAGLDDAQQAGGSGGDGGDGSGGESSGRGDGDGDADDAQKKLAGLSLSQKLTLAYAALVGVGGIMGFAKSGSNTSLVAGGGSALILYYVFLNLPTKPIMSSIIGLGISGLLLFVMGSRYSESGKVFPAGVVSLYSLVMAGGYIHGIARGH